MIKCPPLFLYLAPLIFLFPLYSVADTIGKVIYFQCASCHNEKLQNLNLPQSQLEKKLLAFKYSQETAVMTRISKGFTDKELSLVANYISALK
jgi:cytochrome c553